MSTILYHGAPNGPSLTALAALFETGATAELRPIDLASGGRYAVPGADIVEVQMSVEGEGPILVADGQAMTDSVFIGLYLDERQGTSVLRPEGAYGHWQVLTFCRWVIERVAPAAAYLATEHYLAPKLAALSQPAFDAIVAPIGSDDVKERWTAVRAGDFEEDRRADSLNKIALAVERIEAALDGRSWLLGTFSLADLESYAWLASMVDLVPEAFDDAQRTLAWLDRVKTRPSVARALALAGDADPLAAWAPGPEINRWG